MGRTADRIRHIDDMHDALVELGHAIDRVEELQLKSNSKLTQLREEHDNVMAGTAPGCRHIERMEGRFWKFLSVGIAVPLLVMLVGYWFASRIHEANVMMAVRQAVQQSMDNPGLNIEEKP